MNVLLSIKPRFVAKILAREKTFEFRRAIFTRPDVTHVVMYASSPVRRIVGFFTVGEIIADAPARLWERCKDGAGLEAGEFFQYFSGKRKGFAIRIEKVQKLEPPIDPREVVDNFRPPQSFSYFTWPPTSLGFIQRPD